MKMQVTYEDESVVTYKVKPRHLVAYEDQFGDFAETAKSAYALAHIASQTHLPFTEWLNEVDDIKPVKEAGDAEPVAATDGEGAAAEPVPTE